MGPATIPGDARRIEDENLRVLESLNQRGGRMLSVVDLHEAGTVTTEFLAYACLALERGASFLVGARPGAAGKTTVMAALLGLLPPGEPLHVLGDSSDLEAYGPPPSRGSASALPSRATAPVEKHMTLLCHEIGEGRWYGYLWGPPVLRYLRLSSTGVRVVSNLHADDLPDLLGQLGPAGVTRGELASLVEILIFLRVSRGAGGERKHRVSVVLEAFRGGYRTVFGPPGSGVDSVGGTLVQKEPSALVPMDEEFSKALKLVKRLLETKPATLERVRAAFLELSGEVGWKKRSFW
ncbi:MAG: hypothetical protein ACTSU5_20140 [Promethearchaeota archaeon]